MRIVSLSELTMQLSDCSANANQESRHLLHVDGVYWQPLYNTCKYQF